MLGGRCIALHQDASYGCTMKMHLNTNNGTRGFQYALHIVATGCVCTVGISYGNVFLLMERTSSCCVSLLIWPTAHVSRWLTLRCLTLR